MKTIKELGEFGLIEHLTKDVRLRHASTRKGIGDDAAVIDAGNNEIVITTDLLLEGIHFDLTYTPLRHLGYKAVVVNLSDVAAMNAVPRQITVSLGISAKMTLKAIEEFYDGIKLACQNYDIDLVGGDTSSSLTGLAISITAIGFAAPGTAVYRSGAQLNDLICVSGDLGASYMGLSLLQREKKLIEESPGIQPKLSGFQYLIERQLKPEARFDILSRLKELEVVPTSMIDISDGLSSDLLHICQESKLGCRIYADRIPTNKLTEELAEEMNIGSLVAALNGGEDYELLFTISVSQFEKINEERGITIIGHITEASAGSVIVLGDEKVIPLSAQGWGAEKAW
jgi:thiamine-monophosphate kinase